MHTIPYSTSVAPGQIQVLEPTRGAVLIVEQGTLWITQTHDPNDHVLCTGQSLPLTSGRVVLEAAPRHSARYRIEPAHAGQPFPVQWVPALR